MYKIEERHRWKPSGGKFYLRTRLYQSEATFKRAWKKHAYDLRWKAVGGYEYRLEAYKINTKGKWQSVSTASKP